MAGLRLRVSGLSPSRLLRRRLTLHLALHLGLVGDKAVQRLQQVGHLILLGAEGEGQFPQVEKPFPGLLVAVLRGRLQLAAQHLQRLGRLLGLSLELLVLLVNRLHVHDGSSRMVQPVVEAEQVVWWFRHRTRSILQPVLLEPDMSMKPVLFSASHPDRGRSSRHAGGTSSGRTDRSRIQPGSLPRA